MYLPASNLTLGIWDNCLYEIGLGVVLPTVHPAELEYVFGMGVCSWVMYYAKDGLYI